MTETTDTERGKSEKVEHFPGNEKHRAFDFYHQPISSMSGQWAELMKNHRRVMGFSLRREEKENLIVWATNSPSHEALQFAYAEVTGTKLDDVRYFTETQIEAENGSLAVFGRDEDQRVETALYLKKNIGYSTPVMFTVGTGNVKAEPDFDGFLAAYRPPKK